MAMSTSTKEVVGTNTPDGLVVNSTKIALYNGGTPVAQAAAIPSFTSTGDTTTNLAAALYAVVTAISTTAGIGICL
jgi:hypothetical protein